jgi:phosphatidylinositol alpha-1,6-mannosyltransferase
MLKGPYLAPLPISTADGDGVADPSAGVLGLFPSFETTGGVQASGRLAWRGVVEARNPSLGERYLISYGRKLDKPGRPAAREKLLVVSSRLGAVAATVSRRWPVRLVIVWHLDLLKYLFFLRVRKANTVVFLHGIEAWRRQSAPVRMLLRRAHRILSNSDHTWEQFVQHNPTCRSSPHRTVHLGIGEPLQGEIPGPARTPIALMIGRLLRSEDYKGHREVISAWPRVVERVPGAALWIVGDGDLRADLEMMVRDRGMTGHVRFLGALLDAARDEVLLRSRCLLMPSRGEGFGLVYLEAMRVGRPCLVSTLDAGREVINPPEAGLAVDPAETRQVADAVSRLLTPGEEWDGWSIRARRRYEERFTAVHFEQRLVAALSEVVGSNGSAA